MQSHATPALPRALRSFITHRPAVTVTVMSHPATALKEVRDEHADPAVVADVDPAAPLIATGSTSSTSGLVGMRVMPPAGHRLARRAVSR